MIMLDGLVAHLRFVKSPELRVLVDGIAANEAIQSCDARVDEELALKFSWIKQFAEPLLDC